MSRWDEKVSKYDKIGCCGNMFRFILFVINFLFFLLGVVVFITAAVLKWGNTIEKLNDIPELKEISYVGSINTVAIIIMIVGAFITLLSLFGLLGVKFLNRPLLIIYESIVVLLFLTHGISILVIIFASSGIETKYKEILNNTMNDLNANKHISTNCDVFKGLSEVFHCCGVTKPSDFINQTLTTECCAQDKNSNPYTDGCGDKSFNDLQKNAINLLIIPSAVILLVELFSIITVPFLIGRINKN